MVAANLLGNDPPGWRREQPPKACLPGHGGAEEGQMTTKSQHLVTRAIGGVLVIAREICEVSIKEGLPYSKQAEGGK